MEITNVTMKKNVRKNCFGALMMGVLLCILPFFSSCSDEETTVFDFNVQALGYVPEVGNKEIYDAIVSYLEEEGIINRQFSKSFDGYVDVESSEELARVLSITAAEVEDRIDAVDFQAVLRDAGISVEGHSDISIVFSVQMVDATSGYVWKEAQMTHLFSFD